MHEYDDNELLQEILEIMHSLSKRLNDKIHIALGKSDPFIEIESFLYSYTIVDNIFYRMGYSKQIRNDLLRQVISELKSIPEWIDSRFNSVNIEKVIDNRIECYYKILSLNNGIIDKQYFINCIEYQVQLIGNIINNHSFSFYNPVPQSVKEYSPIILSILLSSTLNNVLIDYMNEVIEMIKVIHNFTIKE